MFERYSENARRLIFFAKYEAANMQSPHVEPEHLLLGLLRQDKQLAGYLLHPLDSIREKVEARASTHAKHPPSGDAPLSAESKRVLANAVMLAENRAESVATGDIFRGLLGEEKSFAAELLREGLRNSNRPPGQEEYLPPFTFTLKAMNPRLTKADPSKPGGHHEAATILARRPNFGRNAVPLAGINIAAVIRRYRYALRKLMHRTEGHGTSL